MWKKIEVELPPEYLADLQQAADNAGISVNSQILVAIARWRIDSNLPK